MAFLYHVYTAELGYVYDFLAKIDSLYQKI